MINKVGVINNNYVSKINFKSSEPVRPVESKEVESSNLQLQANYGIAQLKLSKLMDIKPLKSQLLNSTNPEDYEGVKVYNSEGKFAGVVNKNERTTSYYLPILEEDKIGSIKVVDNKTNKLIYQETLEKNEDDTCIYVEEFLPVVGKKVLSTVYENGEIVSKSSYSYSRNGNKTVKTCFPDEDVYKISETNMRSDRESTLRFANDFKDCHYGESYKKGNVFFNKDVTFYNGALISTYESKESVIPNMVGREPLQDKDLVPAQKFSSNFVSSVLKDGEKKYYSNGSVESITKNNSSAEYNLKGDLMNFEFENTKVYFYQDGSQEIIENLGENISKLTIYDAESGSIVVEFEDNEKAKYLHLNSKLQPETYSEHSINSDNKEYSKDYYYRNGMLTHSY